MIRRLSTPLLVAAIAAAIAPFLIHAGTAARDEIVRQFTVASGSRLVLDADRGDVDVRADDISEIRIKVTREVKCATAQEGQEKLANHHVTLDQAGDTVTIKAARPDSKLGWIWKEGMLIVHYDLVIPRQVRLDLKTSGGKITVGDLEGEVVARTSAGDLAIGRIAGPVRLSTSGGSIQLAASTQATLSTSAGNIKVGAVQGPLNARTSGGSIEVKQANGAVETTSSAGDISLGEMAASVKAHTSGGSIHIVSAKGESSVESSAGDIRLGTMGRDVTAVTSGGSIDIDKAEASVDLRTSAGNIRVGSVGGSVHGHTSGGGIRVALTRENSFAVDLSSSAGDVEVTIPDGGKYDLEAHASGGDITTDVPVTVTGKRGLSSLNGQINGGGPLLRLRSSGGSIRVARL